MLPSDQGLKMQLTRFTVATRDAVNAVTMEEFLEIHEIFVDLVVVAGPHLTSLVAYLEKKYAGS